MGEAEAEGAAPQELSAARSMLAAVLEAPDEHLGLVTGLRALSAGVVAAWVSKKCDAALVVALVALVGTLAALPVAKTVIEASGPALPGVGFRLDLWHLAGALADLVGSSNRAAAAAACGVMVVAAATALGWIVSKRSPVLGLVLYLVTFVVNVQSRFLDDYPAHLIVPVVLGGLSLYSRHIRYLNLAAVVFAAVLVASEADSEPPEIKELAPIALWAGFALLVAHDVLMRAGVVEWLSLVVESAVLVFVSLVLAQVVAQELYGHRFGFTVLDRPLSWGQLLHLECLPDCMGRLEATLPGLLCTFFCAVTVVRNVVGRRTSLARSGLAVVAVVGLIASALFAAGREAELLRPNTTSVIGALALVISERAGKLKGGLGDKGSALEPSAKRVGYHVMVYWKRGLSAAEKAAIRERGARGSVTFAASPKAAPSPTERDAPSEDQLEKMWAVVRADFKELDKARKTYHRYRQMAFQTEAMVTGLTAHDDDSRKKADEQAKRAEMLNAKCREAAVLVKKLERRAKQSDDKAKEMEAKAQVAGKKLQ